MARWPLLSGVWSLPGNVANLAASKPGDALESENMVKLLNAFKHRHRERATRGCLRLGQNGTQSSPGRLTWPGAHSQDYRCSRANLNSPVSNAEHGNAEPPGHAVRGRPNRKAGRAEAALRRPNKPRPGCNAPDMPTSVRSLFARETVEPSLRRKSK